MRTAHWLTLPAVLLTLSACTAEVEPNDTDSPDPVVEEESSIIATAEAAGGFDTLLAAVDAAGLTQTLDGEGSFTVFAPTDDAFGALPEGTVEALLDDTDTLTDILLYHAVSGEFGADYVIEQSLITTLQGTDFKVTTEADGSVFINGAQIIATDIEASNGIIHVIDAVIMPPPSITEIAVTDGRFDTLVAALTAADLADTLAGDGPFTVFAPTDDAFAALPDGTVESLLEDIPALTDVLLYHVAGARIPAADVVSSTSIDTLQGSMVDISVDGGVAFVGNAEIILTDIPAANGIIHVIDAVLLPE